MRLVSVLSSFFCFFFLFFCILFLHCTKVQSHSFRNQLKQNLSFREWNKNKIKGSACERENERKGTEQRDKGSEQGEKNNKSRIWRGEKRRGREGEGMNLDKRQATRADAVD